MTMGGHQVNRHAGKRNQSLRRLGTLFINVPVVKIYQSRRNADILRPESVIKQADSNMLVSGNKIP